MPLRLFFGFTAFATARIGHARTAALAKSALTLTIRIILMIFADRRMLSGKYEAYP